MNRDILFRGKSKKTGRWIYSNLWSAIDDFSFFVYENSPLDDWEEVDDDTCGQYVGINDCKDSKIFEHDFIQEESGKKYLVEWEPNKERFVAIPVGGGDTDQAKGLSDRWIQSKNMLIIGNVIDNPELIK